MRVPRYLLCVSQPISDLRSPPFTFCASIRPIQRAWYAHQTTGKRRAMRGSKSFGRLAVGLHGMSVLEECRFIPLRLGARERGLLAMLKGALNVSEYTDR